MAARLHVLGCGYPFLPLNQDVPQFVRIEVDELVDPDFLSLPKG